MSKRYDRNYDPTFKPGSSKDTGESSRVLRSNKNNLKPDDLEDSSNGSIEILDEEIVADSSKAQSTSTPIVESKQTEPTDTSKADSDDSNNSINSNQTYASVLASATSSPSTPTSTPSTSMSHQEEEAFVQRTAKIIAEVLRSIQQPYRQYAPKLDVPKLTMRNYSDWAKKIRYALKLNHLWVDPNKKIADLTTEEAKRNSTASLYLAIHLDDKNSAFVNDSNEKNFIEVWNTIKKFHEPKTGAVMSDIYSKIFSMQHQSGECIQAHLMKLDDQFSRFHDIGKQISEEHLVAMTLATIKNSPEFEFVFQSAQWEDQESITLTKIKSVLISTQKSRSNNSDNQSMQANFKGSMENIRVKNVSMNNVFFS